MTPQGTQKPLHDPPCREYEYDLNRLQVNF